MYQLFTEVFKIFSFMWLFTACVTAITFYHLIDSISDQIRLKYNWNKSVILSVAGIILSCIAYHYHLVYYYLNIVLVMTSVMLICTDLIINISLMNQISTSKMKLLNSIGLFIISLIPTLIYLKIEDDVRYNH